MTKKTAQELGPKKYKNSDILQMFRTLKKVDEKSPNMDFAIRYRNKGNFDLLKQTVIHIEESLNDIYKKYGKKDPVKGYYLMKYTDWKGNEVDNVEISQEESQKIYDLETELELKTVRIDAGVDAESWKTDTKWVVITQSEMSILEPIFEFTFTE